MPGIYPIVVKTPAGENAVGADDQIAQEGCEVKGVVGETLKQARVTLHSSGCAVGKVGKQRASKSKRGKVVLQNPKAGKVLAKGGKVMVKLGS